MPYALSLDFDCYLYDVNIINDFGALLYILTLMIYIFYLYTSETRIDIVLVFSKLQGFIHLIHHMSMGCTIMCVGETMLT